MSWDVALYWFEDGTPRFPDKNGEIHGDSLGNYDELKLVLSQAIAFEWNDTEWGVITSPDFTIEVNMPSHQKSIKRLMLHIHEPEFAMHAVHELAVKNNWHVFDLQEGRYIDINALTFIAVDDEDLEEADDQDEFSEIRRRPELREIRYL